MPTIYRHPKKSLAHNRVEPRDLELWIKHREYKHLSVKSTAPVTKHAPR